MRRWERTVIRQTVADEVGVYTVTYTATDTLAIRTATRTVTVIAASPTRLPHWPPAIDSEKWFHQTRLPDGNGWYNGEIQHYTNRIENAYVSDGTLKIVAIRESFTDQNRTKQFTSARLNSKYAFTYGRVDVKSQAASRRWHLAGNLDSGQKHYRERWLLADSGLWHYRLARLLVKSTSWSTGVKIRIMSPARCILHPVRVAQSMWRPVL